MPTLSTHRTSISHPGPTAPSRRPGSTGAAVCRAAAASAVASEPRSSEQRWHADVLVEAAPYSIRIPVPAGEACCPRCLRRFLAAGPTGFVDEQPICDLCLLDGSQPLGMLLALAAVVRTFGAVEPEREEERLEASEELAAFARIYERVAAKSGPPRAFEFPEGFEL
jgi:hypothetical protein